jgi:hypothetical protein
MQLLALEPGRAGDKLQYVVLSHATRKRGQIALITDNFNAINTFDLSNYLRKNG